MNFSFIFLCLNQCFRKWSLDFLQTVLICIYVLCQLQAHFYQINKNTKYVVQALNYTHKLCTTKPVGPNLFITLLHDT